jgi:hypothetical protein
MGEGSSKTREISLGEDFGDVAVKVNGVRVEVHTDGRVDAYTNGAVQVHPVANDDSKLKVSTAPQVGDKMDDGTIFAGFSPDTNKPMYVTPADAPLTYTFNQAKEYAANLDANGHKDWRAPTKGELNVLFKNRAAIGGFNETGSYPAGWYWSSSQNGAGAWAQRFSDGFKYHGDKGNVSSVRCVR